MCRGHHGEVQTDPIGQEKKKKKKKARKKGKGTEREEEGQKVLKRGQGKARKRRKWWRDEKTQKTGGKIGKNKIK